MNNAWSAPFLGLAHFLSHPRLWGRLLLGSFCAFASLAAAFVLGAVGLSHPDWVSTIAWGLFFLILDFVFIVPTLFNLFFYRAFVKQLANEGREGVDEGLFRSIMSSFLVFFKTLRWRLLWPLLLLLSLILAPFLAVLLSLVAASHLFVLESTDLALSVLGKKGKERVSWIQTHGYVIWKMALSSSLLAFFLNFFVLIGWLLWLAAVPVGVFVYLAKNLSIENEKLL